MCEKMGGIPIVVVVVADLRMLLLSDTELDRVTLSGGASIYPMVQNFVLGLRERGLGSCILTLQLQYEPEIKQLLKIPTEFAVACVIPVGYPERPFPKKLSRLSVAELLFENEFGVPAAAR
jgi:nitroreductase